jgi:hypothetical protein
MAQQLLRISTSHLCLSAVAVEQPEAVAVVAVSYLVRLDWLKDLPKSWSAVAVPVEFQEIVVEILTSLLQALHLLKQSEAADPEAVATH